MSEANQPIYVIKKKIAGHGHHGGAWKVAYADFVTAMMAFFMVMWLMGSSEQTKQAVSGYFRDPQGYKKQQGTGMAGEGEQITISKDNMEGLKDKIQAALKQMPDFKDIKDHVAMTVTGEGLRIELMENEKGVFFNSGSPAPSEFGLDLLGKMSKELAKLPNTIVIEGHTDSKPFSKGGEYTNWELSSDRALSARRTMEVSGLRPGQIKQIRGFADQRLRDEEHPDSPGNRRISVIVQYQQPTQSKEEQEKEAAEQSGEKEKGHGKDEHGKDAHGKDAHGKDAGHGKEAAHGKEDHGKADHGKADHGKEAPKKPSAAH
jgi:chemotaxis protein MotB